MIRAAVLGFLIGAAVTVAAAIGVALLERDVDPEVFDDTLHEWTCPKCDMGCGARGPEGAAWVKRTSEDHRFFGCDAGMVLGGPR